MHKKELVEERLLEADKQVRLGRPVIACDAAAMQRTGPRARYANVLVVQHAAGVRPLTVGRNGFFVTCSCTRRPVHAVMKVNVSQSRNSESSWVTLSLPGRMPQPLDSHTVPTLRPRAEGPR